MAKHVEIELLPDGTVRIEGKEYSGPECEKATADLIALLSPKSKQEQRKPEYYQQNKQQVRH